MRHGLIYKITVKDVTLDLLWTRMTGALQGSFLYELQPNGWLSTVTYRDEDRYMSEVDLSSHEDGVDREWFGTLRLSLDRQNYTAFWGFHGEDGKYGGFLSFEQWRANAVELEAWRSSAWLNVFEKLIGWLKAHYEIELERLSFTPEQERQIENAGSDVERIRHVKEAHYLYWKEIVQQAEASGNVRLYLSERDISKTSFYRAKRSYKL